MLRDKRSRSVFRISLQFDLKHDALDIVGRILPLVDHISGNQRITAFEINPGHMNKNIGITDQRVLLCTSEFSEIDMYRFLHRLAGIDGPAVFFLIFSDIFFG